MLPADLPPIAPIYGHRCLPGDGLENTLQSLKKVAVSMNRPACEIDVWRTADGRWVIVHDPTWKRTIDPATIPAGTPETVDASTWPQIKKMRTKDGLKVPQLKPFLQLADKKGVKLLVEIKNAVPTELLNRYPDVWAYRQPTPQHDCRTSGITELVDAGIPAGIKANGACPQTMGELKGLEIGLAAYNTQELLADDAKLVKQLRKRSLQPITQLTGTWYYQELALRAKSSVIATNPIGLERRWAKAH